MEDHGFGFVNKIMPTGIYERTDFHRNKITEGLLGMFSNEKHPRWKGNNASYSCKHKWIVRHFGKAQTCELKDKTCSVNFEWSNKSGEYKRDRIDWQQLCASHHRRFDGNGVNIGKYMSVHPLFFNRWINQWQERKIK